MDEAGVVVEIDRVWTHPVVRPRPPVSWLSAEELAAELQRVQARRAMDAAYEAELITGLAGHRPASEDPPYQAVVVARGIRYPLVRSVR